MAKHYKAQNKRLIARATNGRFRKWSLSDHGIMGVCPTCRHFLFCHYDGDPRDAFPDPRKFRNRCFTCEPLTGDEKKLQAEIEAARPKPLTITQILERAA